MDRQEITTLLTALRHSGRVRLDDEECAALAHALDNVPASEIALFGSRVERDRRGGDIDVVVIDPGAITPEQQDFISRIHSISLA